MKAVIETGGFQYTVSENEKVRIPKIDKKVGDKIKFNKILALINGKKSEFGKPYLKGCHVEAEVIAQDRYPKVIAFKFKKRKDYKRMKGHRQHYTEVMVSKIATKAAPPKKKTATKEEKPKKTSKKKSKA
jgi:large subunit ribosomal protein L21